MASDGELSCHVLRDEIKKPIPLIEDAFREGIPRDGAGAVPRVRPYTGPRAASGIMPAGITTGV